MRPILALLALAACTPTSAPPQPPCGAAALEALRGQPLAALPAEGPWGALRVIHPGDMVTMDYSESRLNVEVDAAGRISALTCG